MMSWLAGLLVCLVAAVTETWTWQLLRRVPLELAQMASTMGDHWTRRTAIPLHRGFAMAEMLHHLSVVLLLIALVLFLYNMDRAAAQCGGYLRISRGSTVSGGPAKAN